MARVDERLRAEDLRRKGWSIRDIAREVKVSRSSASIWCREIRLTKEQEQRLFKRAMKGRARGRILGASTNHLRKLERIAFHVQEGKKAIPTLSAKELLLVGAAIYWGEGSKKSQLGFINSDPDMIVFMYRWFQKALGARKEDFLPRILINALHKRRDKVIKNYWAQLLGLPVSQFKKTTFIKRPNTKRYSNHDNYFGLLTLRLRNSTELKYKILGLIEGLKYSKF